MSMDSDITSFAKRGSEVLAHFGVPGMKWGVRKSSSGASSNRAQLAGHVAKKVLVVGAKTGLVGALGVVGVPVAVSSSLTLAMNPELISIGKEMAKLKMDDIGLINMSGIDRMKSNLSINKDSVTISARETIRDQTK